MVGWGKVELGKLRLMPIEFQFYKMKRTIELVVVMVGQHYEDIEYPAVHLKWLRWQVLCILPQLVYQDY